MAKKNRHRKGGRVTPRGPRPLSHAGPEAGLPSGRTSREPDFMGNVRQALADDHPLGLLDLVSSLLTVTDQRRRHPFERTEEADPEALTRETLIGSLIGVDCPETSALLTVIATISSDQLERARIRRELEGRRHPLPRWVAGMAGAEAYRAVEMVHVLGDGDNLMLGVRFPTGHELSVVVYIDHNMGTLVKDAFAVAEPLDQLVQFMRAKADDPDTVWNQIDLADARVRITEAGELAAITYPPFETDTWPTCRPLVEWIAGTLPAGGAGYTRPEWGEAAQAALTARFFASPFAAGLDNADRRSLFESILWFGTDYGPGDPLRWSPVAVEILLDNWIPRKIVADAGYLSKAPELLRAFVRFAHAERGIRPSLTAETVAAVDRWEPAYQRTIRSPSPQGPAALLAAVGVFDPDADADWPLADDDDYLSFEEIMLERLRSAVGGDRALAALDDDPLPDEDFVWDDIPSDVHERVAGVLALCDRCCDEVLDVEYRTVCRRFLAAVASGDPDIFRRKARDETAAGAVCWAVGKANDLFSPLGGDMLVKDLLAHLGLKQGGVSQRAATMLVAGGFDQDTYGQVRLGSPDLLVSSRRRRIIDLRRRYQAAEGPAGL